MQDYDRVKLAIQAVIQEMMDRVMHRVLVEDPFIVETHRAAKPLYAALVPDEIFKGSHFERRFVTPFGKAWERLAEVAANEGLGFGTLGYTIRGNVRTEQLRRIQETLDSLEHPGRGQQRIRPDWGRELAYILAGGGQPVPTEVRCDVYAEDHTNNNQRYAFELKAPLPNSDQTKVSKEKLLKLHCMEPRQIDEAYYALPYNPYGRREDYAWSFPGRWFNMQEDEAVLIGDEFWDKIGGLGTFQSFIDGANEIGEVYRDRIYREFLGIEPPDTVDPSLR
jgi:hypothetical protein